MRETCDHQDRESTRGTKACFLRVAHEWRKVEHSCQRGLALVEAKFGPGEEANFTHFVKTAKDIAGKAIL